MSEELQLFESCSLPWRIAEDTIETALLEDLGEGEVPVEKAVLPGESFNLGLEVGREGLALDEVPESAGGYAGRRSLLQVLCFGLFLAGDFGRWGGCGQAEEFVLAVKELALDWGDWSRGR